MNAHQIIAIHLREATKHIDAHPIENPEDPMAFSHLFWMLDTITSDSMPDTKASRWLGYVYAVLRDKDATPVLTTEQLNLFTECNGVEYEKTRLRSSVEITEGYLVAANELNGSTEFLIDDDSLSNLYAILRHVYRNMMSAAYANFLIGYVQGYMVAKGMMNVNEERDRTRPIFNGQ